MIALRTVPTRIVSPGGVRVHTARTRIMCFPKEGKQLYDSTVKMISAPATSPIVDEMKRTNDALEKIVHILEEFKLRKLDGLVPVESIKTEKD